jgi:phosphonate transport system substrate-binding protein
MPDAVTPGLTVASFLAENARPVYQRIADWLGARVGQHADFCMAPWDERHRLLDGGHIHVAFICGLPYSQKFDRPDRPVELLCAPVMAGARYGGRPVYFTDVVVRHDSPVARFADLRGKVWAYNDKDSNSGYAMPRDHLIRLGETRGYFSQAVASGSHQQSIRMVLDGKVDASGIDSTVLELEQAQHPELARTLRVVESIGPYPIPPVVVGARLPEAARRRLREALLAMHDDPAGRAILDAGLIARFVPVADADYHPIRELVSRAAAAGFLVLR